MAYHNNPRIITDGLVLCVDPNHPRCWDGSSSTITDLAQGLSLTKGSNTVAGTYNGQTVFASNAASGTIDTGYRYGSIAKGAKVVDSAGSWTISGWLYKTGNPDNWWHIYTDGSSGDILTIETSGNMRTSMNNSTYAGVFSSGSDVGDYGIGWNEVSNGWVNIVLIYNQGNDYLQTVVNNAAQSKQTGRTINTGYKLRNFYGWGSAQASYHADMNHSHTVVYNRVLSADEIDFNYNSLKSRFGL